MEWLTARISNKFVRDNLIDEKQMEWFAYWMRCRIMNVAGFIILISAGTLFFPFLRVLFLNLGLIFLRAKTNGMHMPTKLSCLAFSLLCEFGCLFAITELQTNTLISWLVILFFSTMLIGLLTPCNNLSIHLSAAELEAMHKAVVKRLCLYILITFVLRLITPPIALTLIIAEAAVALLVVLAKFGVGAK